MYTTTLYHNKDISRVACGGAKECRGYGVCSGLRTTHSQHCVMRMAPRSTPISSRMPSIHLSIGMPLMSASCFSSEALARRSAPLPACSASHLPLPLTGRRNGYLSRCKTHTAHVQHGLPILCECVRVFVCVCVCVCRKEHTVTLTPVQNIHTYIVE